MSWLSTVCDSSASILYPISRFYRSQGHMCSQEMGFMSSQIFQGSVTNEYALPTWFMGDDSIELNLKKKIYSPYHDIPCQNCSKNYFHHQYCHWNHSFCSSSFSCTTKGCPYNRLLICGIHYQRPKWRLYLLVKQRILHPLVTFHIDRTNNAN